jgi:energy-coupling factor transport system substrate-specific component
MKSHEKSSENGRRKAAARAIKPIDVAVCALGGALLFSLQAAMSPLPNIEPVSLLVVLFTIHFRSRTVFMIYIFALLEGLLFGFGLWWFSYLYIWTILYVVAHFLRDVKQPIVWAVILALYGLLFGTLTSPTTFITLGAEAGFAYIVSGFMFDLIHCASNFVLALLLFSPLDKVLSKLKSAE